MKITIKTKPKSLKNIDAVLLIARVKSNKPDFDELFSLFSESRKEVLSNLKIKTGQGKLVHFKGNPRQVYVAMEKEWNKKKISLAIRRFVNLAKNEGAKKIGVYLDDFEKDNIKTSQSAKIATANAILAHYNFASEFKNKPKEGWPVVTELVLMTHDKLKEAKDAAEEAKIIAENTNQCRTIVNYPPADMSPAGLAEAAQTAAKNIANLKVTVFDEKKLKTKGLNAILAVGAGSVNPPRLIIMEYKGGKQNSPASEKALAIVGKGITFDSGGLNIKPSDYMSDMHMDMSGGAATIYALKTIAELKLPVNVTGFIPAAENMPGGKSYRMQDIIKAYGGKTIEVGHTDAEGRVVMADAIEYSKTKKPALIVTLATLTGAAVVALGERWAGLFVKDNPKLRRALEGIGQDSGDFVWPLPLTEDNERDAEGNFADVTNTSKKNSRYGGASTAAGFLSKFADKSKFAHIDMAPRMTTMADEDALAKGATGFGVAYLTELASRWSEVQKSL